MENLYCSLALCLHLTIAEEVEEEFKVCAFKRNRACVIESPSTPAVAGNCFETLKHHLFDSTNFMLVTYQHLCEFQQQMLGAELD